MNAQIETTRQMYPLFVDTYQNHAGKIIAIACKLRVATKFHIYIHTPQPSEDDIVAVQQLYNPIPHQAWIETYLQQAADFNAKAYYNERYSTPTYYEKSEFLELLYEHNFTLIDTGEQTAWFASFVKKEKFSYAVKALSIEEVGDERHFQIPIYYSKTDLNEIKQRLDSLTQKLVELENKYGIGVRTTASYKKFKRYVRYSNGK